MSQSRANVDPEAAVRDRYTAGAKAREPALCCPVSFDPRYLEILPREILERDYGCGDPTPYVRSGDIVLDLGCGAGKVCWIAAQIAGPSGRVIGVDMNADMLGLARAHHATIANKIGFDNVSFHRAMIQDLRLDLDELDGFLEQEPVAGADGWLRLRELEARLRRSRPLIPDASVDVVLSNCVLNLVRPEDKTSLFAEIHRVLRNGGRAAISDIVADEDVPEHLHADPTLWSGCIGGALREDRFLCAFEDAGFHGIEIVERSDVPWQTVEGIEFRAMTVRAFKGKAGPCLERHRALVYNGPFRRVWDDDGHVFPRGQRIAVCDKTFGLLTREPYGSSFTPIPPHTEVPRDEAGPFTCDAAARRDPRQTKGHDYRSSTPPASTCEPGTCC
jgi:SAM-dependent methyltransferase